MAKSRDNFTASTIDTLAKRSGNCCSNPDCRRLTVGPSSNPEKAIIIGVAAHITAASQGGPRYNSSLTPNERKHISNGIWLCATCSTLIDKDSGAYSEALLLQWKTASELNIRESLLSSKPFSISIKLSSEWNDRAANVANFFHDCLFQAHRGALRYDEEISAIFGNDGYEPEGGFDAKSEVKELRKSLLIDNIEEIGFGLCDDSYSWCMLVKSNKTPYLNDLMWTISPKGGSNNEAQQKEAYLALSSYAHSALGRYIK